MKLVGILTQSSELCNFRGRLISNYNYSSLFKFASKDISVISIGNTSSNININVAMLTIMLQSAMMMATPMATSDGGDVHNDDDDLRGYHH